MAYDAGSARASYELRLDSFEAAIARAKQLYREFRTVETDALSPRTLPARPIAPAPRPVVPDTSAAQAVAQLETAQARAATQAQRLATEQQRTANTAQAMATEEARTARELANAAAAAARAEQQTIRLAQAKERASRPRPQGDLGPALPRTIDNITGPARAAVGVVGGLFAVDQVAQFGIEAGKSALALDRAEKTLRAVTGSTAAYDAALASAKQQQILFGGSLQENIEGLTGLAITAKQSGSDLDQLIDLSQRLGTLDPSQGTAGARIALSEALAGDPVSLAKRYEIPKAALAALRDETATTADKLQVIDDYLNTIGITSATTAGAISDQTQAFNKLGAEVDALKIKAGAGLANLFAPAAGKIGAELSFKDDFTKAQQDALGAAESYEAYTAAITTSRRELEISAGVRANAALVGQQLTAQEFAYAQALIASGVSVTDANTRALELRQTLEQLNLIKQQVAAGGNVLAGIGGGPEASAEMQTLISRATRVAEASPAAAANVRVLTQSFSDGRINAEQYAAGLSLLEGTVVRQANAVALAAQREGERLGLSAQARRDKAEADIQAAVAGQLYADTEGNATIATEASAAAALSATSAKQQYTDQMALMQGQVAAAGDAFLQLNPGIDNSGIAAAVAAGKISTAVGQYLAMELASARARGELAAFQIQAGVAVAANTRQGAGRLRGSEKADALGDAGPSSPAAIASINAATARRRAAAKAETEYAAAQRQANLASSDASVVRKQLNADLQNALKLYGPNRAETVRAQQALDAFNAAQKRAAGGPAPRGLSADMRADFALETDLTKRRAAVQAELDALVQRGEGNSLKSKLLRVELSKIDKQIAKDRERDQTAAQKAEDALRTDMERRASLAEQLAALDAKGQGDTTRARELRAQILTLDEKITEQREAQNRAAIDARLGAVNDAQKRIAEQRELAALERASQSTNLDATTREAVDLRRQEILLEQQKRQAKIAQDAREAGTALSADIARPAVPSDITPLGPPRPTDAPVPLALPAQPIPVLPVQTPVAPPPTPITITVNVDQAGVATVQAPPGVNLTVLTSAAQRLGDAG